MARDPARVIEHPLKFLRPAADGSDMFTAQNVLLVLGGWFAASLGAAAVWARIAIARADHGDEAVTAGVDRASATGADAEAVVTGALEGSAWLALGPLQDRVAGRRQRAGAPAERSADEARPVGG
jgi:hypothetical protein